MLRFYFPHQLSSPRPRNVIMNREMDMWIDMGRVDEIIDKLSKVLMSLDRSNLWYYSCVEIGAFRIGTVHCALQLWFAQGIFMLGCTNNLKAGLDVSADIGIR